MVHFALWPLGDHFLPGIGRVGFEPWQLITSAFLHGGFAHIALNMYALYAFGSMVERTMGSRRFAFLYFASVLTGSAGSVARGDGETRPGYCADDRRFGRRVRSAAGLRGAVPAYPRAAGVSAHSDEGLGARGRLCGHRTPDGRVRHQPGRGALRASRRHARRHHRATGNRFSLAHSNLESSSADCEASGGTVSSST